MDPQNEVYLVFLVWILLLFLASQEYDRMTVELEVESGASDSDGEDDIAVYIGDILKVVRGMRRNTKRKRVMGVWYINPRYGCWFHDFVDSVWGPRQWKRHFRLTRPSFYALCALLQPELERETTNLKCPVSVVKMVACTLLRMANNSHLHTISEMIGLGVSTVHYCIRDVLRAILACPTLRIVWPDGDELRQVIAAFRQKRDFPNCVGAIDATHLCHKKPFGKDGIDYRDRKGRYSTIMQAIVGPNLQFFDVFIGFPGKVHDSRVVKNSPLFYQMEAGMHHTRLVPPIEMYGLEIDTYILGDSGYPLRPWLIVPFENESSRQLWHWNFCHSSTRMVVERAFGVFKGVWRVFNDSDGTARHKPATITRMGHACARLHNWMIANGEIIVNDLPDLSEEDYVHYPQRWNGLDEFDEMGQISGQTVRQCLFDWITYEHDMYDSQ